MSIIKKIIKTKGQDLNIKLNLSSNNNLNGLQDSIDDFIIEETGLSLNNVKDGEKTRFTINGDSRIFNWKFSTGYTTTGVQHTTTITLPIPPFGTYTFYHDTGNGGFFDLGYLASEITGRTTTLLSSFFMIQIYDSDNSIKQNLLHTGYYNGSNFLSSGNGLNTSFVISNDDEFSSLYIPKTYSGSTVYMKSLFYNAKTGKLQVFLYEPNESLTTESKLYSEIILLHNTNEWLRTTSSIDFKEIVTTNYVNQINDTLESFNNEKPTFPFGDIFVGDGSYIDSDGLEAPPTTTTTTSTTTTSTTTTSTTTSTSSTTTTSTSTTTSTTSTTTRFPYSGDLEFVNITPTNFTSVPRNTTFSFSVTVKSTNYYPIPYKLYLDGPDFIDLGLDGLLPSTFSQDQYPDTFTNTVAKDVPFHLGTILDGETDVFEGIVKNNVPAPLNQTWGLFVRLFIDKANNGTYTEAANIVSWDITQ